MVLFSDQNLTQNHIQSVFSTLCGLSCNILRWLRQTRTYEQRHTPHGGEGTHAGSVDDVEAIDESVDEVHLPVVVVDGRRVAVVEPACRHGHRRLVADCPPEEPCHDGRLADPTRAEHDESEALVRGGSFCLQQHRHRTDVVLHDAALLSWSRVSGGVPPADTSSKLYQMENAGKKQ